MFHRVRIILSPPACPRSPLRNIRIKKPGKVTRSLATFLPWNPFSFERAIKFIPARMKNSSRAAEPSKHRVCRPPLLPPAPPTLPPSPAPSFHIRFQCATLTDIERLLVPHISVCVLSPTRAARRKYNIRTERGGPDSKYLNCSAIDNDDDDDDDDRARREGAWAEGKDEETIINCQKAIFFLGRRGGVDGPCVAEEVGCRRRRTHQVAPEAMFFILFLRARHTRTHRRQIFSFISFLRSLQIISPFVSLPRALVVSSVSLVAGKRIARWEFSFFFFYFFSHARLDRAKRFTDALLRHLFVRVYNRHSRASSAFN